MIIFPAIDIQDGKCVRLQKGRAQDVTVFMENPVDAAVFWKEQGSDWLHIIDLDGAFAGKAVNLKLIETICSKVSMSIQIGGGIRDIETAQSYLDAGVTRLIIGTMALDKPELFAQLCEKFPKKIGVSLDTEKGLLKTKGWLGESSLSIEDVLPRLAEQGAAFIIHTDIERDGMQSGINKSFLQTLSEKSSLPLIAAGGLACLDDIKNLYPLSIQGKLEGVIAGRALYEKNLNLPEALTWLCAQKTKCE